MENGRENGVSHHSSFFHLAWLPLSSQSALSKADNSVCPSPIPFVTTISLINCVLGYTLHIIRHTLHDIHHTKNPPCCPKQKDPGNPRRLKR